MTLPHYADHLAPILARVRLPDDVALVAGYGDVVRARRTHRRIILAQHGAGQSYSDAHPHYAGGRGNDAVGLFLVPNEHAADRWRAAYPSATVRVVGCPKLDVLPKRGVEGRVVAVSFHWDAYHHPEARSAFTWYRDTVARLGERFEVIGHGHPRRSDLARFYAQHGIEHVTDFTEVCRRADVYACDNSSTLFEFAATGRPVVVMDAPWYRAEAHHGLRFWDAADVGVRVSDPAELPDAIDRALVEYPDDVGRREDALDLVYTYRTGAARRAAASIMDWVNA